MKPRYVGSFVLEQQVGRGGMGVVYRARCLLSGRVLALKLLPKDVEPTYLKRFEREMEVLRSLRHPHIVQCYGGMCGNEQRYYAMEFVEKSPECRPKDAAAVIQVLEDSRTAPKFGPLPQTQLVSNPRGQPKMTEFAVQFWHELPAVRRKWIAAGGLVMLGVTIGLGLRSALSESPSATQVSPSDASTVDATRTLGEPPPESRSGPSILLFLMTMSVLAGLAAYLRMLNREEEEKAQALRPNVVPRSSQVPRDRSEAQHYLDDLWSSKHFH